MSILFYDHLLDKTALDSRLKELEIPSDKHSTIRQTIDNILHTGILEYIIQKLHPHQHHSFLTQVERAPYDPEIITFLRMHIGPNIETDLEKESHRLINLILKDLSSES